MIYGDVLDGLSKIESNSIDTVISSPPYYGLRDYGKEGQWGLEETPELYLLHMTRFMEQIKRVLKDSGTCWINLGDTYAGSGKGAWKEKNKSKETPETIPDKRYKLKEDVPKKSKLMIPERFALNCVMDNWILRNDIIWYKRNRMPFSGKDRFTNSFEHIYFFAKSNKYYFDLDPIREACITEYKPFNVRVRDSDKNRFLQGATDEEVKKYRKNLNIPGQQPHSKDMQRHSGIYGPNGKSMNNPKGKNPGDMWDITVKPFKGSHYATFPIDIPLRIIKCACPEQLCNKCGKARESIVKRTTLTDTTKIRTMKIEKSQYKLGKSSGLRLTGGGDTYNAWKEQNPDILIGYTDCGCNAGFKPGIVLDPFMGSGTTAQAAQQLGRDWIGIDIDKRNDELLRKRLG